MTVLSHCIHFHGRIHARIFCMGLNFCTPLNLFYSLFTAYRPKQGYPDSGIREIFAYGIRNLPEIFSCEIRALGIGICYSAQGIWNPLPGNLNPTLSWIPAWGEASNFHQLQDIF